MGFKKMLALLLVALLVLGQFISSSVVIAEEIMESSYPLVFKEKKDIENTDDMSSVNVVPNEEQVEDSTTNSEQVTKITESSLEKTKSSIPKSSVSSPEKNTPSTNQISYSSESVINSLDNQSNENYLEESQTSSKIARKSKNLKLTTKSDISSYFKVGDFQIIKSDDTIASNTNGISHSTTVGLSIDWEVKLPEGQSLSAGDTVVIPVLTTDRSNSQINITSSGFEQNLYDHDRTIIGKWTLVGRSISIVFNEEVEGKTSITDGKITSDKIGGVSSLITQTANVTVGNKTKEILFIKPTIVPLPNVQISKSGSEGTNQVSWIISVNTVGVSTLGRSLGKEYSELNNVVVEDTLEGDAEIFSFQISAPITVTMQDENDQIGEFGNNGLYYLPVTSGFQKIDQLPGESYSEFKNRLTELQYGFYRETNGVTKIVAKFGDVGNNGLRYTDFTNGNEIGTHLHSISTIKINEIQEKIYNTSLGSGNVINGQIGRFAIQLRTSYPNYDQIKAPKQNTATITGNDLKGPVLLEARAASNTITPDSSSALASDSAKLIKKDKDTSKLLSGAQFRLQKKNTLGSWENYQPLTGEEIKKTDDMGSLEFKNLPEGVYRFKEVVAPDGYDINSIEYDIEEFIINSSNREGIIVRATNDLISLTNVSGQKIWEDNNNQDGLRPDEITIILFADGEEVRQQTITAASHWQYLFSDLPQFDGHREINYTVSELDVPGYESYVEAYDIVNKHTPETINLSGSKRWEDENDRDGKRPETITVNLWANDEVVIEKEVKAEDNWQYSFNELPKYKDGKAISYRVSESPVPDYTSTVEGYDLTNTY
ncbi:Cna B-type domain-containing protein, partial [Vagococcus xieshaowenii]